jgi:hypothetical protein
MPNKRKILKLLCEFLAQIIKSLNFQTNNRFYNLHVLGLNIFLNSFFHPQTKWMKMKSQGKKGLKSLIGEQPSSQGNKA